MLNFSNYNKTYGAVGGVIVLLTWMYLSMLVFLIGGELSSELQRGPGSVVPRSGTLYSGRIETSQSAKRTSDDRVDRLNPLPS